MSSIFKSDSGNFGSLQAENIIVTGNIKIGENTVATETYVTQAIGGVVDYQQEINQISGDINTVSGNLSTVSGNLEALESTVDAATGDINIISGAVEDLINAEVADDTAFNTVSGKVDLVSGNLEALESTVDAATGDINIISGAVEDLINAEKDENIVITNQISSLSFKDADLDSDISSLQAQNLTSETDNISAISSLSFKDADLDSDISSLQAQNLTSETDNISAISSLSSKDLDLEGNLESLSGTVDSIIASSNTESVIQISGNLNQVSGDLDSAENQLNSLQNTVDIATGDIETISGTLKQTNENLYGFYDADQNLISNVSGNFNSLSFSSPFIPTSGTDSGTAGQIAYDNNYVYICVADNTWRRLLSVDFD